MVSTLACGARGPGIEPSLTIVSVVFFSGKSLRYDALPWTRAAHVLHCLYRSTQPSTLRGTVSEKMPWLGNIQRRWLNVWPMWQWTYRSNLQLDLRVVGQLALTDRSEDPSELSHMALRSIWYSNLICLYSWYYFYIVLFNIYLFIYY